MYEDASPLVLNDHSAWYYPSTGFGQESITTATAARGNWGNKTVAGSRWARKGKSAPWGPGMDEWEAEERARKRIKTLLPPEERSPSLPVLPHLRSPTPPLVAPYPPPTTQHLNFSTFILDKAVTHSFRSNLLDELEQATNNLIEGEAVMRRALGRLWQAISEDPHENPGQDDVIPKREEPEENQDGEDELDARVARAPDLTPATNKLFLASYQDNGLPVIDPSQFASPEIQKESLEKSLATLRELQDDGREYVERLEEIREIIGDARAQRNTIWGLVRERTITEFQEQAFGRNEES